MEAPEILAPQLHFCREKWQLNSFIKEVIWSSLLPQAGLTLDQGTLRILCHQILKIFKDKNKAQTCFGSEPMESYV